MVLRYGNPPSEGEWDFVGGIPCQVMGIQGGVILTIQTFLKAKNSIL